MRIIRSYQAIWDVNKHEGIIRLRDLHGEWSPSIVLRDPNEFSAVVDLLRNEKPITADYKTGRIGTGEEMVGEGE